MAKKSISKMPQTLYAYQEQDGDRLYLVADYERDAIADKDEARVVGTYRLVETGQIVAKAHYERR